MDDFQGLFFGAFAHESGRNDGQGNTCLTVVGQFSLNFFCGANKADLINESIWHQVQGILDVPSLPGHPNVFYFFRKSGINHELSITRKPARIGRYRHAHQISRSISVVGHGTWQQAGHVHVLGTSTGVAGAQSHCCHGF